MTVVKSWVLAATLIAVPVVASAQQASRTPDMETIRARQKISVIEGMLERAVQNGANNFSRQIQAAAPNADGMAMLMGAPLVRGFTLEGHGVFFDVQMPSLQLSMVWPLRYTQGADAATVALVAELRRTLETVSDPQTRLQMGRIIQQLEQQLNSGVARSRRTGATSVANAVTSQTSAAAPPPVSPADMGILDDPAEAWRTEVRNTLIDAMIEMPGSVTVRAEEYIIVAARGVLSPDRLVADAGDARTMELKLKGSDLMAVRAGSISPEDARKRVIFREY
jgi:hypothetical protein